MQKHHNTCYLVLLAALLVLSACQPTTFHRTHHTQRSDNPYLGNDFASFRKKQIVDVDYQLAIQLDAEREIFNGQVTLNFELASGNNDPITIDFYSGKIHQVKVNGEQVAVDYEQWFFTLPAALFNPGKNKVEVAYETKYSTLGEGLHRYQDKQTGNVYLYTNFEPFSANKFFPHFDQPNLKARYTLTVTAPARWHVISATRETDVTQVGDVRHWAFPQTAKIPSYIFPLHAGDYVVWEDNSGVVPLRLFARKELAEYVVPSEWFNYTHASFEFFNEYFEFPYPFGKYDQLIVPEFNWGAMENLGAVTFSEKFVTRGTRTEAEKISLSSVIAHEMAHMWFGNITTMDWWNGLWLNESFATYMAYLAIARTGQVEGAWETFYSRIKQWAYLTDQQVTTHPIELPVNTTSEAFSNFDGITYGKGASVLKQLPHYLGEENFRRGVANYLKKFSYSNTTLDDFVNELGKASDKDLTEWTKTWLFETGLNSIQAHYSCTPDRQWLNQLSLAQTAPKNYPTLREQTVQVGLFRIDDKNEAVTLARIPVTYRGANTRVDIPAQTPCPDLIYPNLDDWGYVKVLLDHASRATLTQHLSAFKDDSLRLMLWETFWDGVQDAHIPLTTHVDFALQNLAVETNLKIIERVANTLDWSYDYFTALAAPDKNFQFERQAIEEFFWQQTHTRNAETDRKKIFFEKFIVTAHTEKALDNLRSLLHEHQTVPGLKIDQDLRWQILLRLNQFEHRDYAALSADEMNRDNSQRGIQSALAAEAIRPDPEVKQLWLERIFTQDKTHSLDQQRTVMQNLFPVEQNGLRAQFSSLILSRSGSMDASTDDQSFKNIGTYLAPNTCTRTSANQLAAVKDQLTEQRPILGKSYRIAHHENLRCLRIGELM